MAAANSATLFLCYLFNRPIQGGGTMNTRRSVSVSLLGLGLVILTGLFGCDRRISAPPVVTPPTTIEPKTDVAEVIISTPSGVTVTDLRVRLVLGTQIVRDTTAASVSDQQVLRFGGLDPGTYIVIVTTRGYQVHQAFVSIVDMQIPRASIRLRELASDPAQTVVTVPITDPSVPTVINIGVPNHLSELAEGMFGGALSVTGTTGNVTAILSGQSRVPVVDGDKITTSVVIAMSFQLEQVTGNTSVTVTLPIPVGPQHHAAIAGQFVTLYTFDFTTLSWRSIGTARIGPNGTVEVTRTGAQLGENNIIAIGKTPTIGLHRRSVATIDRLSPVDLQSLRDRGVTTLTYNIDPVVLSSAVGKAAFGLPEPPAGIPLGIWELIGPWIWEKEPELRTWVYDGGTVMEYSVPTQSDVRIDFTRTRVAFTFTYNWGGGVVNTYEVTIEFTSKGLETITIHIIEAGGGN
jgi:hypothetical protein